jgi:hypothetical protein
LLSHPDEQGVTAVVVYPMNALINSQFDEFHAIQGKLREVHRQRLPYLIIGDDIWSLADDNELLPESSWRMTKQGPVPDSKKKAFFPTKVYFDEFGNCSETMPMKWWGWFMKAPLLFDPTGGVFYDTKTNEGTKLTKLGSEGRSTSTTITAFSILNQLNDSGFEQRDQKLLSSTDNRQDAALQARHFNDFVQVVRLRAGIRKALAMAPSGTLSYATIGEAVLKALGLPFLDFANRNEDTSLAPIRRKYEHCLQDFLTYRDRGSSRIARFRGETRGLRK